MKKIGTLLMSCVPLIIGFALQIIAMLFAMLISAVFVYGIAPVISGEVLDYNDLSNLWMDQGYNTLIYIIYAVASVALFGIWFYKSCGGNFLPNLKKTFHPWEALGIAFLIPGTQYLCTLIVSFVSVIFPSWLEAYEELLDSAGLDQNISLLMMLYSVILAPICEELIFRGVTLRILERSFPFWFANIFQAFLFGFFHLNLLQGVYTFFVGLVMGYIFEKGGSIYHAIFFHFLFNLWGTTASEWLLVEDAMVQALIIIFGMIFGLVFGFLFLHKGINAKKEGI